MVRYILRRLLQAIPVLLGTTFLIYAMVFALPGDPVLAMFGERNPTPQQLATLRAQYHLDQPFFTQYLLYVKGLLTGDFGVAFSGRPVLEVMKDAFPFTLRLAVLAIALEFLLSVTVGLVSGLRKGKLFDTVSLIISLVLLSVPIFVLAFVAQYFLGVKLKWFPVTVSGDGSWSELLLPAIVLALSMYATSMRLARASVIDTLGQDFVRTAYAKGLRRGRVIPVHVLRNSLIPVVTNSATNLGILIVGATVTEGIFNVPGVGRTLFRAIRDNENMTVVSFVTVLVLIYVLVNLVIDLLYAVLDPRIRYA